MTTVTKFLPTAKAPIRDGSLVNAVRSLADSQFHFNVKGSPISKWVEVRYSPKNRNYEAMRSVGNGWSSIAEGVQMQELLSRLGEFMVSEGFEGDIAELKAFTASMPEENHDFASPMYSREGFFSEIAKYYANGGAEKTFNDHLVYDDAEFFESHSFNVVTCPYCGEEVGSTNIAFGRTAPNSNKKIPGFGTIDCPDCDALFHVEVRQDSEGDFYVWNATL